VDTTARAVIELSLDQAVPSEASIFHVQHPKTLFWNKDFLPALKSTGLNFEEVDQDKWVDRLAAKHDGVENPPVKLLEYYKNKYGRVRKAGSRRREKRTDMTNALEFSKALREAQPVDGLLIRRFLEYWMNECWNSPRARSAVEARL
jgi:hypothetical protein